MPNHDLIEIKQDCYQNFAHYLFHCSTQIISWVGYCAMFAWTMTKLIYRKPQETRLDVLQRIVVMVVKNIA